MDFFTVTIIFAGLFTFAGGFLDWDWFMNHRRARFVTTLVRTRRNARILYMALGIILIGTGILEILGITIWS